MVDAEGQIAPALAAVAPALLALTGHPYGPSGPGHGHKVRPAWAKGLAIAQARLVMTAARQVEPGTRTIPVKVLSNSKTYLRLLPWLAFVFIEAC